MDLKEMFKEPEHQPFQWERGECAVLLVHGYTGTPGEVRPLGWSLRQAGWTVSGILLPGMGGQIDSLLEHRYEDWVKAASEALGSLKERYSPVLLVGFSMGGAIVQHAAAAHPPDGLVLMAPASQFGGALTFLAWPILSRIMPRIRPFGRANFSDPRVRKAASRLTPGADLNEIDAQERIRRLSIPMRAFHEPWRLVRATQRLELPGVLPTLVVQGAHDRYARPAHTRRLLQRLPGPLQYREVAAGHTLMGPRCPVWLEVERTVLEFAETIRGRSLTRRGSE
jgi:carboxylesterase